MSKTAAVALKMGRVVRSPQLVRGETYVMKTWNGTPNRTLEAVKFLGVGRDTNNLVDGKNPRLKDLAADMNYWFNGSTQGTFGAYNHKNALAVGTEQARVTFAEPAGSTPVVVTKAPKVKKAAAPKAAAPKAKTGAAKPKKAKATTPAQAPAPAAEEPKAPVASDAEAKLRAKRDRDNLRKRNARAAAKAKAAAQPAAATPAASQDEVEIPATATETPADEGSNTAQAAE